jgi:acetyltransferase
MQAKSLAVLGASESGMGAWLLNQAVDWGFPGPVYPVNPRRDCLRGLPCYPSLSALPEPPELVAIALGAHRVKAALEEAAAVGAKAATVIASGFAEAGGRGAAMEAELRETADRLGLVVNGPNNYGVASLHDRRVVSAGPLPPNLGAGDIALLFGSGALTHGIEETLAARGIGLSHVITVGNEAQTGFPDYLTYLATDPHAKVIACMVEGFRDPQGFEQAARLAAANGKRIVLVKTGRSELSKRAALAHTGALVGADRAIDAWLRKIGVVRVKDLDELTETSILLARYPHIGDGNVGIASVSGGGSGILADLAVDTGLALQPFTEQTDERLRAVLPEVATPNNPLDVTPFGTEEPYRTGIIRVICEDPDLSVAAWAWHSPVVAEQEMRDIYSLMIDALGKCSESGQLKPAVAFTMVGGSIHREFIELGRAHNIPLLVGARNTLAALAAAQSSASWLGWLESPGSIAGEPPAGLLHRFRSAPNNVVSEREMKSLLASVSLPVTREALAKSEEEAERHFLSLGLQRAALKVESADIPHKSASGGVVLNVDSAEGSRRSYRQIMQSVSRAVPGALIDGVLVQEMAAEGVDVFVGCTIEPGIGPVLALGAGGVLVEALDQVATGMCPMGRQEAAEFVGTSPAAALLRGRRGAPDGDVDALTEIVHKLSHLAWWLKDDIAEFDVNPVRVFAAGSGAQILDALAVKAPAPPAARPASAGPDTRGPDGESCFDRLETGDARSPNP